MTEHFFVKNKARWKKISGQSYLLDSATVETYDKAILLPIREIQYEEEKTVPDGIFEGGVCSPKFEFLAGLRRNYKKSGVNWSCDRAYELPKKKIKYRDETVIFGGCLINHFGHALMDGTARMWYLADAPKDLKIVFLNFPRKTKTPFDGRKFAELMGIDPNRLEIVTEPTQFKQVIVPQEAMYSLTNYRPEYIRTFDRILENINPQDSKKVFLSVDPNSQVRAHVNIEYYESFFARRGFTVVYPERLSLEEQIAYVAGADEIVTIMGTIAHLILFAKPTAVATVLNRSHQCLLAQILVSQAREIELYYVDAIKAILPTEHISKVFFFAPNDYFKEYLDVREIEYKEDELKITDEKYKKLLCTFVKERARREPPESMGDDAWNILDELSEQELQLYVRLYTESLRAEIEQERLRAEIERERLRAEIERERLRAEIERLRNSKSWKVTKPLRLGTKAISKLKSKF